MLDFRSRTASTPYYRQRVDYGRLVMMVVSSILLMSIILTFGRPRNGATIPATGGSNAPATETSPESRTKQIGVAVLVGSLCVVACVMLVLYRFVRPGRVRFTIHDLAGPPPDFTALADQPPPLTPQEAMADIAAKTDGPHGSTSVESEHASVAIEI